MSGGFGYSDPEDDEEAANAAARPKSEAHAWGDSDIVEGEDGTDILTRMARSHAELAMRTLVDVSMNGIKDAARVAASKEILARGYGTPTRKSEQTVDVKISDQRAAHYEALKRLAEQNPVLQIEDAEFEEVKSSKQLSRRFDDDE